jgi:hypothetical protein
LYRSAADDYEGSGETALGSWMTVETEAVFIEADGLYDGHVTVIVDEDAIFTSEITAVKNRFP